MRLYQTYLYAEQVISNDIHRINIKIVKKLNIANIELQTTNSTSKISSMKLSVNRDLLR
jgi:hypothetical protein